jgi:hypothetical protein
MNLGNLSAGTHTFQLSVPDAVFVGSQGYIPVSLYLQGNNTVLGVENYTQLDFEYYPNPTQNYITVSANSAIKSVQLCDMQGRVLVTQTADATQATLDVSSYSNGIYFLKVNSVNGEKTKKIVKE